MHKNNWLIITLLISFLFLLTSYIPNFYEISISDRLPQERVMTPAEHIYTYDYNVYLSKIKQGTEDRWTVVDKYDNNTNQKGVFMQMLYLLAGKAGGLFGLGPTFIFHILRTVLSSALILTIVFLNFYFFKKPSVAFFGVLLSLFAASWPVFYQYQGSTWVGIHMGWWTEMDVLKRISYLPHYTLNYIIISLLSVLLYKSQKTRNPTSLFELRGTSKKQTNNNQQITIYNFLLTNNYYLITCILLFFSFFIHPASGLLFLISWCIFHLISFIQFPTSNFKLLPKNIVQTLIIFAVAAIPLLYFKSVTNEYPWKSLVDYDRQNRIGVNIKEYILALGPVFYTGLFGAVLVLVKKEKKYLPLVTWILGAFLAILAFKKFPLQSELRFVQTANHIPLALLSVYFLFEVRKVLFKLRNYILLGLNSKFVARNSKQYQNSKDQKSKSYENLNLDNSNLFRIFVNSIISLIIISIVGLGITQSYFSIKAQTDFIHQRVVAGQPLVPYPPQVMYPLKDMFDAFIWLEKYTKNEAVVLSQIYAGNYIPAYSGNYVYLGHNPETPNYNGKVQRLDKFYSGTMLPYEAQNFLKEENISYVLYGPQEREKSVEDIKKYDFLKEVFNTGYVKLFQIR